MARNSSSLSTADLTPSALALLLVLAGLALLAVYAPACSGPFVSDDIFYVARNPYVQVLSLENLRSIWLPSGGAAVLTLNYAPVHLVLHALQWQLFGEATRGYHLTSLALHLATGAALFAFYRSPRVRPRLPAPIALAAAGLFLLHPANVEAVAWIFQVKSVVALLCGLLALVCAERRPGLASLWFGLGLLTKISAAFALPVLATQLWCRHVQGERVTTRDLRTLCLWILLLAAVSVPVASVIARAVASHDPYPDLWVHARSSVALAMRYLAMAASGHGTAAFQEPPPALSPFDPWWLAGAGLGALALARFAIVLRRGAPEAIHWTLAFASFVPVSQIFPFQFPLADRYLYAILPGLLGVAAYHALTRISALERRLPGIESARRLRIAALALAAALGLGFAAQSHARARIWADTSAAALEAARVYPEGLHGQLLRARQAAARGDGAAAGEALRAAFERGARSFAPLLQDPAFAGVREHPAFRAAILQMARWWIERIEAVPDPIQQELWTLGSARGLVGDLPGAIAALEQAAALGGPDAPGLLRELDARRLEQRLAERLGPR